MMKNIIEINSVTKTFEINTEYDNLFKRLLHKNIEIVTAVDDVSLCIPQGSMVALLGKNGAGKTTLIKMMSGIISPTSGSISVAGFDPHRDRYKYSYHIGVVLGQKSLLWHNIPVRESLNLYRSIYDISKDDYEKRLAFFGGLFECERLLDVPVRKLSLGERMKFEIMAALLHEPQVLFLDEPTIGLDILSKKQMYSFLKRINKENDTTIILTTHNIDDVENLCERVVLLDEGRIIYDGDKLRLRCYDETRTICVKGSIDIDDSIQKYLDSQNDDEYIFKCNLADAQVLSNILQRISVGSDITISGADIEDVLLKIYEGELELHDKTSEDC